MKFWTRFAACFLVAWLPLAGYAAQATVCPEMSSSAMQRPMSASPMTGTAPGAQKAAAHAARAVLGCHGYPGSLSCGMAALPTTRAMLDIPSSSVFRATIPLLAEQFIPEPLQPPPRTL
ncbi:hypothetical protein [Paraburkholderia sediminicola]|uniref:hypothetical protein n=1 Tax=Paraburkholderia sediminicola TaxID=458836 RepID=UPI0038BB7683